MKQYTFRGKEHLFSSTFGFFDDEFQQLSCHGYTVYANESKIINWRKLSTPLNTREGFIKRKRLFFNKSIYLFFKKK